MKILLIVATGYLALVSCDQASTPEVTKLTSEADEDLLVEAPRPTELAIKLKLTMIEKVQEQQGYGTYLQPSARGFLFREDIEVKVLAEDGLSIAGALPQQFLSRDQTMLLVPVLSQSDKITTWVFFDETSEPKPENAIPGFTNHENVLQRIDQSTTWSIRDYQQLKIIFADSHHLWVQNHEYKVWHLFRQDHRISYVSFQFSRGQIIGASAKRIIHYDPNTHLITLLDFDDKGLTRLQHQLPLDIKRPRLAIDVAENLVVLDSEGQAFTLLSSDHATWGKFDEIDVGDWLSEPLNEIATYGSWGWIHSSNGSLLKLEIESELFEAPEEPEDLQRQTSANLANVMDVFDAACSGCHAMSTDSSRYDNPVDFDYRLLGHWHFLIDKEGLNGARNVVLDDMCHRSQPDICASDSSYRDLVIDFFESFR